MSTPASRHAPLVSAAAGRSMSDDFSAEHAPTAAVSHQAAVPLHRRLYVQVVCGILIGVLLGHYSPDLAQQMKPLGDLFIKLIKMMIAPIVFTTVTVGIARIGDLKQVGRVGLKAIVYFEAVTSVALLLGLLVVNVWRPGDGLNADAATLDTSAVSGYVTASQRTTWLETLLGMVPDTVVGAFVSGEMLQVLLFSVLFGLALSSSGQQGRAVVDLVDRLAHAFFGVMRFIMMFAPLGAFGAMAFTIGKYGVGTLHQLGVLVVAVYATCLLFVFVVLGLIARCAGFSLWRFLVYIREELLIVLGTSTSESVLPRMMVKLEQLGCAKPVVGLVVPTGYSFNLDGTSIYLTMAAVFIAQAMNIELSWGQQLGLLGVLLLTSKGAAAVTGGGFITLAATLSTTDTLPVAGLALLLGVDRFLSEARALTNLVGNGVATIVVARWEGALDRDRLRQVLSARADD